MLSETDLMSHSICREDTQEPSLLLTHSPDLERTMLGRGGLEDSGHSPSRPVPLTP